MSENGLSDRIWLLLTALLVVTVPALTLALAYTLLATTQSALANQFTPIEILELYLAEVVGFVVFGYLLYRLMRYGLDRGSGEHHRPSGQGNNPATHDGSSGVEPGSERVE